jgi:hypothetical protein
MLILQHNYGYTIHYSHAERAINDDAPCLQW